MSDSGMPKSTSNQAPVRVLFLCTHNSSRSQMAEGLLRARGGSDFEALSAGTESRGIHPLAIAAMAEIGIDISEAAGHRSKSLQEYVGQPIDLVVTVCDEAAEACPYFPGARRQAHWGFPDPSAATGSEEERLAVFRQVRDAIAARLDVAMAQGELRAPDATQAPTSTPNAHQP
ncbi:MAG TPA: arsenate reductase ArsC [Ktedonobacterales bacterium]|nr:arsenate reductase ArsC [Ktedonobacterales bacterium]